MLLEQWNEANFSCHMAVTLAKRLSPSSMSNEKRSDTPFHAETTLLLACLLQISDKSFTQKLGNHQMSQEFGQKLKKRCILKKNIFFSWFKVHKNSISVIGPSLLQMLFFRNVSPKNIEKDNQNMFLHILCTLMTENTKKYT